ncbi:MAG: oligosaccharide flippase family protein [Gracilimonas sp.]|nr:oligosaccharide flippase family protein [Gracilimonas sp.]
MMTQLKEKAFWILAGDLLGRGMSFFASIYLARTLGAEYYGLILFAISILGYANWFADMGLYQIGSREKAKPPEKRIFRISEIFNLRLILGVTVILVSALLLFVVDIDLTQKKVLLGFLISLVPYMFLMEWFYAGKQDFGKITLSKTVQGGIYLALIIFMVKSTEDVQLVPLFYAAGVLLASITLGVFAFRDKPFTLPSRGKQIYPDLFKSSSIIGLGQLSAQVIQLLPPILIGLFMTFELAGIYGVAFKIVILAMMIDRVFVQLLLPNLSSLWVSSKSDTREKVSMIFRVVLCTGSVIALFTALSSYQIIYWMFGTEYLDSIYLLKILSIFIGLTFVNSLFSFGLIATNHDTEYFKATLKGGSISALLLLLTTYFGNLIIVTISVVLSELIITGFAYLQFKKVFSFNYFRPFLSVLALTLILYFVFNAVPVPPVLSGSLASIILMLAFIRLNLLTQSDVKWLKSRLL